MKTRNETEPTWPEFKFEVDEKRATRGGFGRKVVGIKVLSMVFGVPMACFPSVLIISMARSLIFREFHAFLSTLIYICLSPAQQQFFFLQHLFFFLLFIMFHNIHLMHVRDGESREEIPLEVWGRCVI